MTNVVELMRQRFPAILLLFILTFYIGRPVIPFIQYGIFKSYIAKNLCINKNNPKSCCQGKCYLKKQLKNNSENEPTEKRDSKPNPLTKEVKEYVNSHIAIPRLSEISLPHRTNEEQFIISAITLPIFVPPENLTIS